MIYKSSISKLNKWVYAILIIFLIMISIPTILEDSFEPLLVIGLIDFLIILFLVWIYRTTYYRLQEAILFWKSGPIYGQIAKNTITKIAHHNGIIVPTFWKPALSHIGLIITYNKFDDIYISPEKSAEMLRNLPNTHYKLTKPNE